MYGILITLTGSVWFITERWTRDHHIPPTPPAAAPACSGTFNDHGALTDSQRPDVTARNVTEAF